VALGDLWDLFMKESIFCRWLGLGLEMGLQEIWSLLQEAEIADDGVELQIEEKDSK